MNIKIPGFTSPAVGLDQPLEILEACHERVKNHCQILQRLSAHLKVAGIDDQAILASKNLLRYFEIAAKNHHEDEENNLFPMLLESMAGSDAVCINEIINVLKEEHILLENIWQSIKDPLELIASGTIASIDETQILLLATTYEKHINLEENELFPMAKRLLNEEQLKLMSHDMTQRRKHR
jgi:hemerythrin-like domain-containing protein